MLKKCHMTFLRFSGALAALVLTTSCVTAGLPSSNNRAWYNSDEAPRAGEAYSDFLIARFAAMTNDPVEAAQRYAAAIETAPENSGIAERAVFSSLLAGEYDRAVKLAKVAEVRGSDATLIKLTLGVDAIERDDQKRAAVLLDETSFGPFNRMVARGLSAWGVSESEGADAAVQYLTDVLTGDPSLDSATLYLMGLIQMSAGDDDAALVTFNTLWMDGARLAVGVEAYAELLAAGGDRAQAAGVLKDFRANVGQNASLQKLRGKIEAGDVITPRRLSAKEGAALALYVPAAALTMQTDDDLAGVYFVLALALNPDLHVARSLWGQALDNAGRRGEAIQVLEGIPFESDFYATARGQMAWAYRREGQNQKALDVAGEALAHSPDRDLKVQLSDLYRSMERHGEAEAVLTEVITEDAQEGNTDWRLLYARGAAREQLGRWPEAEADLRAAIMINADDASLLNYLGYAYVDRGKNLNEAFDLIRKAVALKPNSGYIVDSLGWAHYRFGRYEMALRYLERAVELEPADSVLNDHLGDVYWHLGRRLEARFQWERALKLEPTDRDRAIIEDKLGGAPPEAVLLNADAGLGESQLALQTQ